MMTTVPRNAAHRRICRALVLTLVLAHTGLKAEELASSWKKIGGGPGTGCASGSDFAYFARVADPRRLMVFFEGGGACWNGTNCDETGEPTFDGQVDAKDHPSRFDGLFNLAHAGNPVRDFSILFIPYCTGDAHLGTRNVRYRGSRDGHARHYLVRHQGAGNVAAALGWLDGRVVDPDIVFVAGSSAGAIPTPIYAALLAHRYNRARVIQLGDAGGGYRSKSIPTVMKRWGAARTVRRVAATAAPDGPLTFEALYAISAQIAPNVTFAQFNNADDEIQADFLRLFGAGHARVRQTLRANLSDIRAVSPDFRTFVVPGRDHTILASAEFFTLRTEGVAIRDWVAARLEGTPVSDVGSSVLEGAR